MSSIDVDSLVSDISASLPCGEDLEYDPQFLEMNQAAESRPASQMIEGGTADGEGPDWRKVRSTAQDLCTRTRDLRVAVLLSQALLAIEGFPGFRDGLSLIHALIDRQWDFVHPMLDAEDDNDPTFRVNTVASLTSPETTLKFIKEAPLVELKPLGRFSMRDIEVASGQASAPAGTEPPDMNAIDAAFMECDLDELKAINESVAEATELAASIESTFTEKVGTAHAIDMAALPAALKTVRHELAERLSRRGVEDAAGDEEGAGGAAAGTAAGGAAISGEIRSREDVIRVLDKACDYYARYEPSSPVPLLLQRAKRLVSKDFMDIIRDMAAGGLDEVRTISGDKEE